MYKQASKRETRAKRLKAKAAMVFGRDYAEPTTSRSVHDREDRAAEAGTIAGAGLVLAIVVALMALVW